MSARFNARFECGDSPLSLLENVTFEFETTFLSVDYPAKGKAALHAAVQDALATQDRLQYPPGFGMRRAAPLSLLADGYLKLQAL